jgi:uncharacterized membrane protein
VDAAIEHDVFLPFEKRGDDARAADFRAGAERDEFQKFPEFLSFFSILVRFSNRCVCSILVVVLLIIIIISLVVLLLFSGELFWMRHVSL